MTAMCPGTVSIKFFNSVACNQVPVGLFGLAIKMSRVLSLIIASIAVKSCP